MTHGKQAAPTRVDYWNSRSGAVAFRGARMGRQHFDFHREQLTLDQQWVTMLDDCGSEAPVTDVYGIVDGQWRESTPKL